MDIVDDVSRLRSLVKTKMDCFERLGERLKAQNSER